MPGENIRRKRRLSSFQIIILGFAGVILLGALLLMLPISTTAGGVTPFNETLFTATSAVCVTGLVVQDTGSYWSAFGQAVILTLIQCYSFSVTVRMYGAFNAYILISLLRMAAYILPAVTLFMDRRDRTGRGLILAGLGILAFLSLYDFFHGFAIHSYSVYDFYYSYYSGSYYTYHFNLFCMLPALIELFGFLSMFAVSLCLLTGYLPKSKTVQRSLVPSGSPDRRIVPSGNLFIHRLPHHLRRLDLRYAAHRSRFFAAAF